MERSALSCLAYGIEEACGESQQFDLVNLVINLNGCKDGQSMKRSFPSTVSAFDCNQFCCQKKTQVASYVIAPRKLANPLSLWLTYPKPSQPKPQSKSSMRSNDTKVPAGTVPVSTTTPTSSATTMALSTGTPVAHSHAKPPESTTRGTKQRLCSVCSAP